MRNEIHKSKNDYNFELLPENSYSNIQTKEALRNKQSIDFKSQNTDRNSFKQINEYSSNQIHLK